MLVETHPDKPLLIVNPTSGGGAASRYDLVGQCRARGIEPVISNVGMICLRWPPRLSRVART